MEGRDAFERRRAAVANAAGGGVVLVPAGLPVPIAGTDQFHEFHAHPEHRYLAGTATPGATLAFDADEGWSLFVPGASEDERVWVGEGASLAEAAEDSRLDLVRPSTALGAFLERRRGERIALLGNDDFLGHPAAYGAPGFRALEADIDGAAGERLSERLAELRRAKDAGEIAAMRAAVRATAAGHLFALRNVRPGMTERALQVEVEAEFFRAGSPRTAYGSIVGGGPNGAVLHFSPTARSFRDGELVLMDAAAEWEGYAADVTRTFPVSGTFEGAQRDLYALVLHVQQAAIDEVAPGKEYRDLHMAAATRMAAGLADLGILRGSAESLVERDAHAIFFPHGLGHMLGLSTHDAGGCLAGRTPSDRFGLKWLRADLPLEEGYVVTVEPGVYFIRALLTSPEWRARYRDEVNWPQVDTLLDFGGIRIEDDVLVTSDEADVLSAAIPKDIEAIEALRWDGAGA